MRLLAGNGSNKPFYMANIVRGVLIPTPQYYPNGGIPKAEIEGGIASYWRLHSDHPIRPSLTLIGNRNAAISIPSSLEEADPSGAGLPGTTDSHATAMPPPCRRELSPAERSYGPAERSYGPAVGPHGGSASSSSSFYEKLTPAERSYGPAERSYGAQLRPGGASMADRAPSRPRPTSRWVDKLWTTLSRLEEGARRSTPTARGRLTPPPRGTPPMSGAATCPCGRRPSRPRRWRPRRTQCQ
jgi:hypothetical protein